MQDQLISRLNQLLHKYNSPQDKLGLCEYRQEPELKKLLELETAEGNQNWDEIFDWIEKYLQFSPNTASLDFNNRMWSKATLPSVLAEIVTATNHSDASTYESAPVATLMEKHLIIEMLKLVGFENGEGQMTSGSSNANMIAMMCARNLYLQDTKTSGLYGNKKLISFVNEDAHYSFDKAANILGLGSENTIKIPVDENGRMKIDALKSAMDKVLTDGNIVFFVAATAGTTVRGAFDCIEDVVSLQEEYKFWLHLDGAWGGPTFLSPKLKEKFLKGLEKVDSFTFDFHKMSGIALICNMFLINKRRGILKTTCSAGNTNYIFHGDTKEVLPKNLGEFSLQCGRKIDSLKLFLDWKFYGQKGIAKRIENFLSLAEYAESYINNAKNLELIVKRESFNLCFRFKVPSNINSDHFNQKLRNSLLEKSIAMVGTGVIHGELIMRYVITNSDITKTDVETFLNKVEQEGLELLKHTS